MTKYTPLNTTIHKDFAISLNFQFEFCQNDTFCYLMQEETERAAAQAPVVFLKNDQGSFDPAMLLSLEPGQNKFLNNNLRWTGDYMPAIYRCYPFALLTEETSQKQILGFDPSFSVVTDHPKGDNVRLFDADGSNSKHLDNIIVFLNAIQAQKKETRAAMKAIETLNIIEEWKLQLSLNGQKKDLTGLWKVSKEKFNSLSNAQHNKLRDVGALTLIYSHFVSLFALHNLVNTKKSSDNASAKTLVDRTKEKQAKETKQSVDNLVQGLLSEE
jgi:hypothetical protein